MYYVLQLLVCVMHTSSLQLYRVEHTERKGKYLIVLPSVSKTCDPLAFYVTDRIQEHVETFLLQPVSPSSHLLSKNLKYFICFFSLNCNDTWSFNLRKEYNLRVFKNEATRKVGRNVFG